MANPMMALCGFLCASCCTFLLNVTVRHMLGIACMTLTSALRQHLGSSVDGFGTTVAVQALASPTLRVSSDTSVGLTSAATTTSTSSCTVTSAHLFVNVTATSAASTEAAMSSVATTAANVFPPMPSACHHHVRSSVDSNRDVILQAVVGRIHFDTSLRHETEDTM